MNPDFIDLYCERIGQGFWNEPLNALTNIVFIAAAFYAWRVLKTRGSSDRWETGVVCLAGLIGIGSFLFHTFATTWAAQADIIPIWAFVMSYALLASYRLGNKQIGKTLIIIVLAILSIGVAKFIALPLSGVESSGDVLGMFGGKAHAYQEAHGSFLNGSDQYLPAIIALLIFTGISVAMRHPARNYFVGASTLFCISLLFRTIDITSCEVTHGLGTHFLWHAINGFVVALLLLALINTMPPKNY